ncbi:MAG TPA: SAM-dependent chlorinase/fluorinase [Planctomycetota bacterium]|nr:SAM-dependent chlorinase/fluorinase [Planctomycetota bacterium]
MADSAFSPCGLVVLLTDFGLLDPYVGVMHGVIAGIAPAVRVIDLTHGVSAQDVRTAAFFLSRTREHFPAGSIFVAVVDPGVGSSRRILTALDRGQLMLAPDNGLVGPALGPQARLRSLDMARFATKGLSATFHGRDVFAPVAAGIGAGALRFEELGPEVDDCERLTLPAALRGERRVQGEVLFADRYGNLITNVEAADLGADPRAWRPRLAGRGLDWVATYSEARADSPSILVNSYGLLEVAVAGGSAQRTLGVGAGALVEFER